MRREPGRSAARDDAAVEGVEIRFGQPILHPRREVDLHLDAAADPLNAPQHDVR